MKKLSTYAKENDIHYKTAYRMAKQGLIKTKTLPTGTILVISDGEQKVKEPFTVVYARVSSSENKGNLDKQAERLISFCNANGWTVDKVVKEIGSGLNDNRKQLTKILHDGIVSRLVVEHQDRLTRFGCNYIELICRHINCELIVVNPPQDEKEDLIEDFVSIITSFCARIYGHRRSKRKTEEIIIPAPQGSFLEVGDVAGFLNLCKND